MEFLLSDPEVSCRLHQGQRQRQPFGRMPEPTDPALKVG
jgi:hypothetical protein